MTETFDFAIVGAGMMGSAAARHLALTGASVVLIGPGEPADTQNHTGVFASHYDEARITRRIDSNADWSRLATASIRRYADIEEQSGLKFYHESGCLMASTADSDFMRNCQAICAENDIPHARLSTTEIGARFPFFSLADGVVGLFEEKEAGFVNPRAHVAAQKAAARRAGATLIEQEVVKVNETGAGVEIACADGSLLKAAQVVLSCGPFANAEGLLPAPLDLRVFARTIALVEVGSDEVERLKTMPSLIYVTPDDAIDVYVLPPVRYPNGKTYLKLGGGPLDQQLTGMAEMKAWFRSEGDVDCGRTLVQQLLSFMPDLKHEGVAFKSCATTYTRNTQPAISRRSDRIIALCGGNGMAAKSSDEIGRIGAALAQGDADYAAGYGFDFQP